MVFKSDTVAISHDISVIYSPAAGSKVIELLCNNPNQIKDKFGLGKVRGVANGLLDELRCYAAINSIDAIKLPDILGEDTESEKLTKAQSYEWNTARFELVVFKKAKNQSDWAECGVSALKNAGGFRWRMHRLLDLVTDNIGARVGEWGRIGVAVRSVGYGFPQAFDRISITGNWVQEYTWVEEHPTYVVVNNYGSTSTSTPTPTPTPAPTPTFALSLVSGTSAVANNDEKINLTVANVPTGTQLTGSWFKAGLNTGVIETVTTTGSVIQLSTLKLKDKLSGNYSLRLFYQDAGYLSNEVSITVNPEATLTLPTGITSARTGDATPITITGRYLPLGTFNYQWLKGTTVISSSSASVSSDGTFTLNQTAAQFQNTGAGNYRIKFTIAGIDYFTNEIAVTITQAPTVAVSPTDLAIQNYYSYQFTVTLAQFVVGDSLTISWLKNDVEIPATTTTRTFTQNSGSNHTYTIAASAFGSAPYTGAGVYKAKVVRSSTSTTIFSNTINVRASDPQPSLG